MLIHGAKPRSEPEIIQIRLADLAEAFRVLTESLHKCDGTMPGNPMMTREMAIAKSHLDTAWLWAKEAVESN
jgi:hypothetical protein